MQSSWKAAVMFSLNIVYMYEVRSYHGDMVIRPSGAFRQALVGRPPEAPPWDQQTYLDRFDNLFQVKDLVVMDNIN